MIEEPGGTYAVKHIGGKRISDYLCLRLELRPAELAHIAECEQCVDDFNACAAAKHVENVQAHEQAASSSKKAA